MDVSVSRRIIVRIPENMRKPNINVRVDVLARDMYLCVMNSHRCISFCDVVNAVKSF